MQELLRTEKEHTREVAAKFKYPTWVLDRMESKTYQQNKSNNKNQ